MKRAPESDLSEALAQFQVEMEEILGADLFDQELDPSLWNSIVTLAKPLRECVYGAVAKIDPVPEDGKRCLFEPLTEDEIEIILALNSLTGWDSEVGDTLFASENTPKIGNEICLLCLFAEERTTQIDIPS